MIAGCIVWVFEERKRAQNWVCGTALAGLKESAAVLPHEKSLMGRAFVDEPEER